MRQYRRRVISGNQPNNSGQLMALALFIMMLAFFIVLNAISSYEEEKYRPAMASLEQAFGSNLLNRDLRPAVRKSADNSINEGDTLDKLEALFNAHITGVEMDIDKNKGVLHARLPLGKFSSAVMAVGQGKDVDEALSFSGGGFFVPTLVSLIRAGEGDVIFRMDMLVNISANPGLMQLEDPQSLDRAASQVALFAEKLEEAGVPNRLMSAGLHKGPVETIDIYFRKYEPYSPVEEDAEGAENNEETESVE